MIIDDIKEILGVDVMKPEDRKVKNLIPQEITRAFGLTKEQLSNIAIEEVQARQKIGFLEKSVFMHTILRFNRNNPLAKLGTYHEKNPGSVNILLDKYITYIKDFDMMFGVDVDYYIGIMSELALGVYGRDEIEYSNLNTIFLGKLRTIETDDFGTYGIMYSMMRVITGTTSNPDDAKIYGMPYVDRDPYNDLVKKTMDMANDVFLKVFPDSDKSIHDVKISLRYIKSMGVANAPIIEDHVLEGEDDGFASRDSEVITGDDSLDYTARDLDGINNDNVYLSKLVETPDSDRTDYVVCLDIDMTPEETIDALVKELSSFIQIYGNGNSSKDTHYEETLMLLKTPCTVGGIRI